MALWPFNKKSREPVLTLNRNFYLSILSSPGPLPPLLQVCNPDGSNGAVRGYAIPLQQGASKDLLNEPMRTAPYGFSTLDKKTMLQLDIFERSQVSFHLPSDPLIQQASGLTGDALERAQAASFVSTLVFKGYDPEVYVAVRFFLSLAARMGSLTAATVADPLAETYRLPEAWSTGPLNAPLDFREIGSIKAAELNDGVWVSTRGLAKFNLPEFEMYGISRGLADTAATMVAAAGQQSLIGISMHDGETAFSSASPLNVTHGTRSREIWGDRPTLEFRDPGSQTAMKGVEAWSKGSI